MIVLEEPIRLIFVHRYNEMLHEGKEMMFDAVKYDPHNPSNVSFRSGKTWFSAGWFGRIEE